MEVPGRLISPQMWMFPWAALGRRPSLLHLQVGAVFLTLPAGSCNLRPQPRPALPCRLPLPGPCSETAGWASGEVGPGVPTPVP